MIGFIFNDVSLKEHSEIIMVFIRRQGKDVQGMKEVVLTKNIMHRA